MKIDLEHLHYWMCAIRESNNPMRTLDAFWHGQLKSKEWLVETLVWYIYPERNKEMDFPVSVDIHGGWVGTLASLLFQSDIPISTIRSIDIDPLCQHVANMMNRKEELENRFHAVTADMCNTRSDADIIINTSCEHITQDEYDLWWNDLPETSLIVLQSNNYNIPEHVRVATDLDNFKEQSHLTKVLWSGELDLPNYKRFMIIGRR